MLTYLSPMVHKTSQIITVFNSKELLGTSYDLKEMKSVSKQHVHRL